GALLREARELAPRFPNANSRSGSPLQRSADSPARSAAQAPDGAPPTLPLSVPLVVGSAVQPVAALPSPQGAATVVAQVDGRRMKLLEMTSEDLWAMCGPKLRGFALLLHALRTHVQQRRAVKVFSVGSLLMRLRMHRASVRRQKMLALGALLWTRKMRSVFKVSSRVFALGLCVRLVAISKEPRPSTKPSLALSLALASGAPQRRLAGGAAVPKEPIDPNAPKAKAIHWEVVSQDSVAGTIWDREKQSGSLSARSDSMSPDVGLMLSGLREKFVTQPSQSAAAKSPVAAASAAKSASQQISFLDANKSRNFSISLSTVVGRRPMSDITAALMMLDDEALGGGLDRIQLLASLDMFTGETTDPIRDYDGTMPPCVHSCVHCSLHCA
ncbi:MAG: hypothetical protein EOO65_02315, partial [Methanosarcinales archaeon]